MKKELATWALINFVVLTGPAFAYLDPGTGSILLQALIGGVAATVTIITLYFQTLKAFVQGLFSSKRAGGNP